MQKTELHCTNSATPAELFYAARHSGKIVATELIGYVQDFQNYCRLRQDSPRTLEVRRIILGKFVWFLQHRQCLECGVAELRHFFVYLTQGHESPEGRWGNPRLTQPMQPCTLQTYHKHLNVLFGWLAKEEILVPSPMAKIPAPAVRMHQVQPFTTDHVQAILKAARNSRHRLRDVALILFLLDTGLRASEVCNLKMRDVDFQSQSVTVLGKGHKIRKVYFGRDTAKALWHYLRVEKRDLQEPLFGLLPNRSKGTQTLFSSYSSPPLLTIQGHPMDTGDKEIRV